MADTDEIRNESDNDSDASSVEIFEKKVNSNKFKTIMASKFWTNFWKDLNPSEEKIISKPDKEIIQYQDKIPAEILRDISSISNQPDQSTKEKNLKPKLKLKKNSKFESEDSMHDDENEGVVTRRKSSQLKKIPKMPKSEILENIDSESNDCKESNDETSDNELDFYDSDQSPVKKKSKKITETDEECEKFASTIDLSESGF